MALSQRPKKNENDDWLKRKPSQSVLSRWRTTITTGNKPNQHAPDAVLHLRHICDHFKKAVRITKDVEQLSTFVCGADGIGCERK